MKKIILGLILLVLTTENSFAKQITLYCIEVLELNNNRASKLSTQVVVRSEQEIVSQILKTQNPDWCGIHKRFQCRKLFVETEYN